MITRPRARESVLLDHFCSCVITALTKAERQTVIFWRSLVHFGLPDLIPRHTQLFWLQSERGCAVALNVDVAIIQAVFWYDPIENLIEDANGYFGFFFSELLTAHVRLRYDLRQLRRVAPG